MQFQCSVQIPLSTTCFSVQNMRHGKTFFPHYKHEKQRANLLKNYGTKQQETLAGKCMKTKDMIYPIVVYILHTAKTYSMIMNI